MALNEHSFGDSNYQADNQNSDKTQEHDTQTLSTSLSAQDGIASSIMDLGVIDLLTIERPEAGQAVDVPLETTKQYDLKFDMEEGREVARHSGEEGEEVTMTFDDGGQIKFQSATDLVENALNNDGAQHQALDAAGQSKFLSAMDIIEELIARMSVLEEQYAETGTEGAALEMASLEDELAGQLAGIEPASGEIPEEMAGAETLASDEASFAKMDSVLGQDDNNSTLPPLQEQAAVQEEATDDATAQALADVEPAAGEGSGSQGSASGGGFGFQSDFEAQGVISLDDVGPIDPTKLEYGIEFKNDKVLPDEEETPETPQPVNDIPEIFGAAKTLDETDGFSLNGSGTLVFDFGNDGAGQITTSDDFASSGSLAGGNLSSGGNPVTVLATPSGYEGIANGQTVFTLTVDPQSGAYTYTQVQPLDHADGTDPNDAILLDFGVKISDLDGDVADATINITILDDGPRCVVPQTVTVDETNLSPDTAVSGQLDAHFGNDGAGSFTGNGDIPTSLTSEGNPVDVSFNAATNIYTGTAGGQTIFTLSVATDGTYNFVLSGTLDHPDTTNPNDALSLDFGVRATDFDGDSVDGTLTIKVLDDGPVAEDDCFKVDTVDGISKGNVLDNDSLSADQDNTVTQVTFEGSTVDVDPINGATIGGKFGLLTINADGTYEYVLLGNGGTSTSSSALNPDPSDVTGTQESLTKDGITISVANDGDYDLSWVNTSDGNGLGIDNLNSGDSQKVWPKGETFDIALDQDAQSVTLTISEIGSNNNAGEHGVDFTVTLANGTTVVGEQQFVPGQIVDGTISFTLDAADYGGVEIASIALNSTNDGQYKGASFLLNNVTAKYEDHTEICDQFVYTLTDGDGDSSTATIKFKGVEAELIVGENVDDQGQSQTPHHINGDEGAIVGEAGSDILIGDVGGASIEHQTQDYNFVFVVDVSGSMGSANNANSKISILKGAVENLLNEFGSYGNGTIKVHITPFAKDVKPSATFTVTNADELSDSLTFLDALTGNGYTNYESPLQEANYWLQSPDPLGGDAITTTYFISDGNPNKYIDSDGNIAYDATGNRAMDEITGIDGSNEVALLQSLNNEVIAVGIEATDLIMSRLDVVDSDGDALRIDNPNDLSVALSQASPLNNLAAVGDDVIEGGDGNDIIFGDSVNTDALADDHGLTTPEGNGWDTLDRLENGESTTDPSWSREDTTDYIRDNLDELAEESKDDKGEGRTGGNDTLIGGAGDDVIYGQEGDDTLYGGEGNDILTGGSGADQFMMEALSNNVDVIRDFSSDEGDVLDFAGLIQNFDPAQQAIDDFVFTREESGGTVLSIDVSGSGDTTNAVDFVALEGMQNLDLQALVESGNINLF